MGIESIDRKLVENSKLANDTAKGNLDRTPAPVPAKVYYTRFCKQKEIGMYKENGEENGDKSNKLNDFIFL